MCTKAGCNCKCKPGKPDKSCKCSCASCKNARKTGKKK